jgi:hypothetical protein
MAAYAHLIVLASPHSKVPTVWLARIVSLHDKATQDIVDFLGRARDFLIGQGIEMGRTASDGDQMRNQLMHAAVEALSQIELYDPTVSLHRQGDPADHRHAEAPH